MKKRSPEQLARALKEISKAGAAWAKPWGPKDVKEHARTEARIRGRRMSLRRLFTLDSAYA